MARIYKSYEERYNGHIMKAVPQHPDSEGFSDKVQWQAIKDGKVVHTVTRVSHIRRWIKAQGKPEKVTVITASATEFTPAPKPSRKTRTKKSTTQTEAQA